MADEQTGANRKASDKRRRIFGISWASILDPGEPIVTLESFPEAPRLNYYIPQQLSPSGGLVSLVAC